MIVDKFFKEINFIFTFSDISEVHNVSPSRPNLKNEKAMYRESKTLFIKVSLNTYSHLKKLREKNFPS